VWAKFACVLSSCETCSVTLLEEYRFRVFENKVLKRIFVPRKEKLTGGWRNLHSEELYYSVSSFDNVT
jgi:hypothetical protein